VVEGAGATAWFNGEIDDIRIYNRALSTSEVQELYQYEVGPIVTLIKSVKPSFSNLTISTNYQLQVSTDLVNWCSGKQKLTCCVRQGNTESLGSTRKDMSGSRSLGQRTALIA
jgi:hypothetical protein